MVPEIALQSIILYKAVKKTNSRPLQATRCEKTLSISAVNIAANTHYTHDYIIQTAKLMSLKRPDRRRYDFS